MPAEATHPVPGPGQSPPLWGSQEPLQSEPPTSSLRPWDLETQTLRC